MRLLDRRYAGMAKGVGSAKIHGRVHQVPCIVGTKHISMSFTILENDGMGQKHKSMGLWQSAAAPVAYACVVLFDMSEFLLGLDQLKNHQACIDLQKGVLRIAGEELPFLSEKDLTHKGREFEDAPAAAGSAASSASSAAAAGASSRAPAASSAASAPLNSSGHNVARPSAAVPSSQGSVAAAAHRPAGALTASVPPPGHSPSPLPPAANAAAVAAAQRRAAESAAPAPSAAAAGPRAAAAPASGATAPSSFPESVIETLTDLGFSRAESIQALTQCNGNADLAAGLLFQ